MINNINRLFILFFIFVLHLSANYLNDTSKGTFVDIGKVSGFEEVETPKVFRKTIPNYSIVDNIINNKARNIIQDKCFLGDFGIESCLLEETVCDHHVRYGNNLSTTYTGTVVDRYATDLKYYQTVHIDMYIPHWNSHEACKRIDAWMEFQINDISKLKSARLSYSADDWNEAFVNGHSFLSTRKAWKNIYSKRVNFSMEIVDSETNSSRVCETSTMNRRTIDNVDLNVFKNGTNKLLSHVYIYDGGRGYTKLTIVSDMDGNESNIINLDEVRSSPTYSDYNWSATGSYSYDRFKVDINYSVTPCIDGYTMSDDMTYCSKNISYNYYSYGCDAGYTVIDTGLNSCTKIDTDYTNKNDTLLSSSCNSASAPENNCYYTWETCPVDSSKTCAYKGEYYKTFIPLLSFQFDDEFYKEWEYNKKRDYECTTTFNSNGNSLYDCKYGIQKIFAEDGQLCFVDMQNYKSCISYEDNSQCNIQGSIISHDGGTLDEIIVVDNGKSLVERYHELDGENISYGIGTSKITTECLFNGKIGFSDSNPGVIAVKGDGNRLNFWNSYEDRLVGFLDIVPRISMSFLNDAFIQYNFDDSTNRRILDSGIVGVSKDALVLDDGVSYVNGVYGKAIRLGGSSTLPSGAYIDKHTEDLVFQDLSQIGISFFVKPLNEQSSVLISRENQFEISKDSSSRISVLFYLNDGSIVNFKSTNSLKLNSWNLLSVNFQQGKIQILIDDTIEEFTLNSSTTMLLQSNSNIYIGTNPQGSMESLVDIDNLIFTKTPILKSVQDQLLLSFANVYQYFNIEDEDIKSLLKDDLFENPYKYTNNHVYMVSKDKLTSSECSQLIDGKSFSLAIADGNLNYITYKNPPVVEDVIIGNCKDEEFISCLSGDNTACDSFVIGTVSDAKKQALALEIDKACEEKKMIIGMSHNFLKTFYTDTSDKLYCVIESSRDSKDLHNVETIVSYTKNTSDHIDKFVCSKFDCNANHACGAAVCSNETNGTIGVSNNYQGCTNQSCDMNKAYFPTCGNYLGCPNEPDVVSSSILTYTENNYPIRFYSYGLESIENSGKHEIDINGNVYQIDKTWTIILFDKDMNFIEKKTFNTERYLSEASAMNTYLKSIDTLENNVAFITFGNPRPNIYNNTDLIKTMGYFGINEDTLKNLEDFSVFMAVSKDKKLLEKKYGPRYSGDVSLMFSHEDVLKHSVCYKLSCSEGEIYDKDTKSCYKVDCDDKSYLEDGKCISTIIK